MGGGTFAYKEGKNSWWPSLAISLANSALQEIHQKLKNDERFKIDKHSSGKFKYNEERVVMFLFLFFNLFFLMFLFLKA